VKRFPYVRVFVLTQSVAKMRIWSIYSLCDGYEYGGFFVRIPSIYIFMPAMQQ
jgi:hypothetical protein